MVRSQKVAQDRRPTAEPASAAQVVTVVAVDGAGPVGRRARSARSCGSCGSLGIGVAVAVPVGTQVDLKTAVLVGLLAIMVAWLATRRPAFVAEVRVANGAAGRPRQGDRCAHGAHAGALGPRHLRES
ncbi:hypothetical protein EEZ25_22205 [Micromonospora aurantiaca]|uniref:hypothetical protein n=1 Tax=Micromonospora aurantiaca (nom. illeg.) TaxID=47850 RepID=UPI000F3B3F4D|nr:hypothetical protein [Micromonospora aurantiaca]RNH99696.1 hypothetical protein EEZ25_22205 [Micromonospora aurantiaca]